MTRKQIIDPVETREQQFLKGRHAGVKLIRLDICPLGITCYSTKGCDKCRVHCILKKKSDIQVKIMIHAFVPIQTSSNLEDNKTKPSLFRCWSH